jgi:two-component system CheB/CheR fusion protein
MARLIEETVDDFSELGNLKKTAIIAQIPDELKKLSVFSDYDLIRKVFNHLIGNALKFTEKGNVWIGMSIENDKVNLYVKDTGIGIGENAQKYVFDSFMQEDFSSTRMYEGSGLGLSIVKGIVSILGGEIKMSSLKGKGTIFNFTIPVATFHPI